MLTEKEIKELLKKALEKYVLHLERNSLSYNTYEGEIKAYLNVLNREDLKIKYLTIDKVKVLLNRL
jgi:CRISPR/Cas system-associated protein Cas10 (large subunit of type III CRISPR-Cas system)